MLIHSRAQSTVKYRQSPKTGAVEPRVEEIADKDCEGDFQWRGAKIHLPFCQLLGLQAFQQL